MDTDLTLRVEAGDDWREDAALIEAENRRLFDLILDDPGGDDEFDREVQR